MIYWAGHSLHTDTIVLIVYTPLPREHNFFPALYPPLPSLLKLSQLHYSSLPPHSRLHLHLPLPHVPGLLIARSLLTLSTTTSNLTIIAVTCSLNKAERSVAVPPPDRAPQSVLVEYRKFIERQNQENMELEQGVACVKTRPLEITLASQDSHNVITTEPSSNPGENLPQLQSNNVTSSSSSALVCSSFKKVVQQTIENRAVESPPRSSQKLVGRSQQQSVRNGAMRPLASNLISESNHLQQKSAGTVTPFGDTVNMQHGRHRGLGTRQLTLTQEKQAKGNRLVEKSSASAAVTGENAASSSVDPATPDIGFPQALQQIGSTAAPNTPAKTAKTTPTRHPKRKVKPKPPPKQQRTAKVIQRISDNEAQPASNPNATTEQAIAPFISSAKMVRLGGGNGKRVTVRESYR